MTSYRLGINTCFAVKRGPEPERWARLVAGELELDLVQHSLDLVDLDAPAAEITGQAARLWPPQPFRHVLHLRHGRHDQLFPGPLAYLGGLPLLPPTPVLLLPPGRPSHGHHRASSGRPGEP